MTVRLMAQRYRNGAVLLAAIAGCILNGACFQIYRPSVVHQAAYSMPRSASSPLHMSITDIVVHGVLITADRTSLLLVGDDAIYAVQIPQVMQKFLNAPHTALSLAFEQMSVSSNDVSLQMTVRVAAFGFDEARALSAYNLKATKDGLSLEINSIGEKYQPMNPLLSAVNSMPGSSSFGIRVTELKDDHMPAGLPLQLSQHEGRWWWAQKALMPLDMPVTGI